MSSPKNKAVKTIIDYYDQTAFDYQLAWYKKDNPALHFGFYDKAKADAHYEALAHTNQVLAEAAQIKIGDHILDAGCGLGASAFWLVQNYEVEVTGISLPAKQIKACEERAEILGLSKQTKFLQADYTDTPFPDQSFDVIWACESVCHAQPKRDFYQEAYRLLKPGGRLIMAEYVRTQRPLQASEEHLLQKKWLRNWAIEDIDTSEEHLNNLENVGFQNIDIKNVNEQVKVSLRNLHEKCTRSFPIEVILKVLGIRSAVQHGNLVGSINQYRAFIKKLWWYALIYAQK
ncbi:MAG: methyltransferase domain-containing protein [Bacteroidota bacterium]